ncbi:MAG: winged helix DNA-binding domain-containing protein [Hamadaea sp.]|nr:winged helix DNA-binding domain-containing protein [Hamadaea sp.]
MDGWEIAARRLHNQRLTGEPLADPAAVVIHLGAVQAQEYAVAKWSLGQRSGTDDATVQRALDEGRVVRVHALRPTWHFLAAEDFAWIQALTGPRVHRLNAYYYRQLGIDGELTRAFRTRAERLLSGGAHLTRKEIAAALTADGIDATGNRLAYLLMAAELDGLLCSGAMSGKQQTYALAAERLPATASRDADEALAAFTIRYFASHGPATVKDFAWWSSLTVTQIKAGLALAGPALASFTLGPQTFWYAPAPAPPAQPSPQAHLLQGYDELVVAYTESRQVLNLSGVDLGVGNDNLLIHPMLLDGQLVGSWRRAATAKRITAEVSWRIAPSGAQRRALAAAFADYAAFSGLPVDVV